jgi:hypothetical protein
MLKTQTLYAIKAGRKYLVRGNGSQPEDWSEYVEDACLVREFRWVNGFAKKVKDATIVELMIIERELR